MKDLKLIILTGMLWDIQVIQYPVKRFVPTLWKLMLVLKEKSVGGWVL
jgi:hypothetical protein